MTHSLRRLASASIAVATLVLCSLAGPGRAIATNHSTPVLEHRFPSLVYAGALSPNGRYLAVGGEGGYVWDLRSGKVVAKLTGDQGYIIRLAFSPDGRWLATASYDEDGGPGGVIVRDTRHWRVRKVLVQGGSQGLAYSPDSRWLATGTVMDHGVNHVQVWSASSCRLVMSHRYCGRLLAFSRDGAWLAAVGPRDVRVLNTRTGRIRHVVHLNVDIHSAIHLVSRDLLVVRTSGHLVTYDLRTGKQARTIDLPFDVSYSADLPRTDTIIIAGVYRPAPEREPQAGWTEGCYVTKWNIRTGECLGRVQVDVDALAVSRDVSSVAGGWSEIEPGHRAQAQRIGPLKNDAP